VMPFHMGAFLAAAEADRAVVPIALSGTRSVLRSESWFPRRGPVRVAITTPVFPEGADWAAAIKLRDAARARIVGKSGEPELEYVPDVV